MLSTFSGRSFLKRWVLSALIVKVKKMMITLMKEVKQGGGSSATEAQQLQWKFLLHVHAENR